jgi:hypothetical protein
MISLRLLPLWLCLLLLGLSACGQAEDPATAAGDPLPNVQAGMQAMYSGDLAGVDRYFSDEIVLDAKRIANEMALGQGGIDLSGVSFRVSERQADIYWTVAMEGQYSIWRYGQVEAHDTAQEGIVYIGIKVEDGMWKINGFAAATPEP